jgi:hypothetical protein
MLLREDGNVRLTPFGHLAWLVFLTYRELKRWFPNVY